MLYSYAALRTWWTIGQVEPNDQFPSRISFMSRSGPRRLAEPSSCGDNLQSLWLKAVSA